MSDPDELHTGDWPLTEDGDFAVVLLALDQADPLHMAARTVAQALRQEFRPVRSVYLRGSAVESTCREHVKDVDLVTVVDRPSPGLRRGVEQLSRKLWPRAESQSPCDLAVIPLDRLADGRFSAMIELVLAFRAVLLTGEPLWSMPPRVRPDGQLAARLQSSHRRLVDGFLEKVCHEPLRYDPARLVPWMQKKVLRLGGILAMGKSARLSRYPSRCAALIAETYPELSSRAVQVAADYARERMDAMAWIASQDLYRCLAEHAARLEK